MAKNTLFIKKMSFDEVRTFIIRAFSGYPTHTHTHTHKNKYVAQICRTGTQSYLRLALLLCTTLLSGLNVKYLAFLFSGTFLIIPL